MVARAENARERFGLAAIQLFAERGYDETTVAQIAAAAGLTERTFYRYFVDKPEVLSWRSAELERDVVNAVERAPAPARPLDVVLQALRQAGTFFDAYRADVIARHAVIARHGNLQERELTKMQALTSKVAAALREREVDDLTARVAAEAGVAVWRSAIADWSRGRYPGAFVELFDTTCHMFFEIAANREPPDDPDRAARSDR